MEQQLRQKDRLMLEMHKNLQARESHIATLTSTNISLNSTVELLKHQIAHLTKTNLNIQGELARLPPMLACRDQELSKLR